MPKPVTQAANHIVLANRSVLNPMHASRIFNRPLAVNPSMMGSLLAGLAQVNQQPQVIVINGMHGEDDDRRVPIDGAEETVVQSRYAAILEIEGPLVRKHIDDGCGFVTMGYDHIRHEIEECCADPLCRYVVLHIDSPGGEVEGCFDLCGWMLRYQTELAAAGRDTEIIGIAVGQATSAAQAILSSCKRAYATPTSMVGSIGVIIMTEDQSAYDEKIGVRYNIITHGRRKAEVNSHAPLSDEGRGMLQEMADVAGAIFDAHIATARGLTPEAVAAIEAAAMVPQRAVEFGLIDAVTPYDQLIESLTGPAPDNQSANDAVEDEDMKKLKVAVNETAPVAEEPALETQAVTDAVEPVPGDGKSEPVEESKGKYAVGDKVTIKAPWDPAHDGHEGTVRKVIPSTVAYHVEMPPMAGDDEPMVCCYCETDLAPMTPEMAESTAAAAEFKRQAEQERAARMAAEEQNAVLMGELFGLLLAAEGAIVTEARPLDKFKAMVELSRKPGESIAQAVGAFKADNPELFRRADMSTSEPKAETAPVTDAHIPARARQPMPAGASLGDARVGKSAGDVKAEQAERAQTMLEARSVTVGQAPVAAKPKDGAKASALANRSVSIS